MAAITPTASTSPLPPRNKVRHDLPGSVAASGRLKNIAGLRLQSYFFANIDDNDDFTLPRGVVACAWQANTTTDSAAVTITSDPAIRYDTGATNPDGWIHTLVQSTLALSGTNDETAVQKDTAGYVRPGAIFVNHKSASPNTLTQARVTGVERLRLQVFPFSTVDNGSDTWASTTSNLCPGIVSVAWQANDVTDIVAVTLNASGDVVFTSAGSLSGYLWAWRAR